jgi:hypothetical protein
VIKTDDQTPFETVTKSASSFNFVLDVCPHPFLKIKAENCFKILPELEEVFYFGLSFNIDRCELFEELCFYRSSSLMYVFMM